MAGAPAIAVGNAAGQFNGTDFQLRPLVENSYREQDADSTVRPDFKLTDCCGTYFDPFPIGHRDFYIHKLPLTPLNLFQAFLPGWLVEQWVDYTNNGPTSEPVEGSRQSQWKPTSTAEIWIWSNNTTEHRQRRGPTRALAWSFLLTTAVANSFLLQKLGQPAWRAYKAQNQWQQRLVNDIFNTYVKTGSSRQRYRAGDEVTPAEQHKHVNRKKQGHCLGCQGI
jgi:hypothetical protein